MSIICFFAKSSMFYDCMYISAATYIMTYVIVEKRQTLLDILDTSTAV